MKKSLSKSEYVYIASMLFGMFFGAGNLIFPVYMGQMAGRNMWPALIGFIITGVGLPLLGIVPEDSSVTLAAAAGTALALYTGKGAARACLNIARRLCGRKMPLLRF